MDKTLPTLYSWTLIMLRCYSIWIKKSVSICNPSGNRPAARHIITFISSQAWWTCNVSTGLTRLMGWFSDPQGHQCQGFQLEVNTLLDCLSAWLFPIQIWFPSAFVKKTTQPVHQSPGQVDTITGVWFLVSIGIECGWIAHLTHGPPLNSCLSLKLFKNKT